MGVYSSTAATAYADKIKAVYEYLDEIRKVADRLTPVENLTNFQTQIEELYSKLDLLVEASNLILTATPTGEAILTGSVPQIQTMLGIGQIPANLVTQAQLNAALMAAGSGFGNSLGGLVDGINTINIVIDGLDQYRVSQQATIEGLQTTYQSVAAGLNTNQTNTESALQRLTVQEQHATLIDQEFTEINQQLVSTIAGLQVSNVVQEGHTASIALVGDAITLHTASIDQLGSNLTNLDTGLMAVTTAQTLMETTIEGIGDDIIAQSQQTTSLKSVIGGSGNLLANSDFSMGASGWQITVAEEDWASTLLTTNTFDMPVDVNVLEVLGTPTPLGQIVVQSPLVLLEGNSHYIVSGYPCVDNGTVVLSYKTFNAADGVIDQGVCPATFNPTTNLNFNGYERSWVKFQASTNAVKLRLYLTVTGDGDFITQGALFRPMVEKAWAEQAGPSAWTPNVDGVPQALAEAYQTLSTEVSLIDGEVTAQAGQLTLLTAEVDGVVAQSASIYSSLAASAGPDGAYAQSTVMTDVNGRIAGTRLFNDATETSFIVLADKFGVYGTGAALTWTNGTLWNKGADYSVIIGQDLTITSDVLIWAGPNPASSTTATKEGASFYVTETGEAIFRGEVNQTIVTGSAFELPSTRIHTGGGRLAPFAIKDFGFKGGVVGSPYTITLTGFIPPDSGVGYSSKRFSRSKADVFLTAHMHGDGDGNEAIYLEVQYDGGLWVGISSFTTIYTNYRAGFTMMYRYTTADSWSTVAFRVRTTNSRTLSLTLVAEIDNTYESQNTAGTNSGVDASGGGGGAPPSGGGAGSGEGDPFCVDYNSKLPDGRLVRELQIGDLVECVDMVTLERSMQPLLAMSFGFEDCYRVSNNDGSVIQSKTTPIDMRDGRVLRTPELLGEELLHYSGRFSPADLEFLGTRKVCKPDLGDRMFFAGEDAAGCLATHNIRQKPL